MKDARELAAFAAAGFCDYISVDDNWMRMLTVRAVRQLAADIKRGFMPSDFKGDDATKLLQWAAMAGKRANTMVVVKGLPKNAERVEHSA